MGCLPVTPSAFIGGLARRLQKVKHSPKSGRIGTTRAVEPKIVKEGWLYKRGEYIRTWRRRFFVLRNDGSLLAFKDQPDPGHYLEPTNKFVVDGCQVQCQETPRPFTVVLRGLGRAKTLMYSMSSDEERAEWVQAIKLVDRSLHHSVATAENASESTQSKLRSSSRGDRPQEITYQFDLGLIPPRSKQLSPLEENLPLIILAACVYLVVFFIVTFVY